MAIEEFDNTVRVGYSGYMSETVDLNHARTYAEGLEIATTILEEVISESLSQSSGWHYYKGLLALYSGNKGHACEYFTVARELGYEDIAKVELHIKNLEPDMPDGWQEWRRPKILQYAKNLLLDVRPDLQEGV